MPCLLLLDTHKNLVMSIIVLLGRFHLILSFLCCIGYIMNGSGLKEALSTIYAPNAVDLMLKGRDYSRAVRGHFLVQLALIKIIAPGEHFVPLLFHRN